MVLLLEDIPDGGPDWRCRLRVSEGDSSGWVDVEGDGPAPDPKAVEALVADRAGQLPEGKRVMLLEASSPLVLDDLA